MKPLNLLLLTAIITCNACKEQPATTAIALAEDYTKGLSFLHLNKDSAFSYFNKVATGSTDSNYIALAYLQMGSLQSAAGDYYDGQENLLNSIRHLDEKNVYDQRCLLSNYSEIGTTSLNLKDFDKAIHYADLSLELAKDSHYRIIALNNKALAYRKKRQYDPAIEIYESIIDSSKGDKKEYARILSNLSHARWLRDPKYPAVRDLLLALQIRKEIHDTLGQTTSYDHLTDYYTTSHPDSALMYARYMYTTAQQVNNPDDELEALQKLIKLSPSVTLKQYFTRYQYLNDSVQTARSNARNQFALIRFEVEKNKADNLRLQKENADKKVQLLQQRIFIYGTAFLLIAVSIIIPVWYRKRKQKMLQESRNIVREHKLQTSQKVHDVVANGIYRIMTTVEHQDVIEKEPLLNNLEVLYEQSRDISYEQPEIARHDFQERITSLLSSFASSDTKILIVGNEKELWTAIKDPVKKELEQVLQELMVNMKKHSKAQNVVIKFEQQDDLVKIQYIDDGVGLPPNFSYGNGLTNTGNRIESMGGRINFDRNTEKGLKIEILLPTATIQV